MIFSSVGRVTVASLTTLTPPSTILFFLFPPLSKASPPSSAMSLDQLGPQSCSLVLSSPHHHLLPSQSLPLLIPLASYVWWSSWTRPLVMGGACCPFFILWTWIFSERHRCTSSLFSFRTAAILRSPFSCHIDDCSIPSLMTALKDLHVLGGFSSVVCHSTDRIPSVKHLHYPTQPGHILLLPAPVLYRYFILMESGMSILIRNYHPNPIFPSSHIQLFCCLSPWHKTRSLAMLSFSVLS